MHAAEVFMSLFNLFFGRSLADRLVQRPPRRAMPFRRCESHVKRMLRKERRIRL